MKDDRDYTVTYYYAKGSMPAIMRPVSARWVFRALSKVIVQVMFKNYSRSQLVTRIVVTDDYEELLIEYTFEYYEREKYGLLPPVKRIRRVE